MASKATPDARRRHRRGGDIATIEIARLTGGIVAVTLQYATGRTDRELSSLFHCEIIRLAPSGLELVVNYADPLRDRVPNPPSSEC